MTNLKDFWWWIQVSGKLENKRKKNKMQLAIRMFWSSETWDEECLHWCKYLCIHSVLTLWHSFKQVDQIRREDHFWRMPSNDDFIKQGNVILKLLIKGLSIRSRVLHYRRTVLTLQTSVQGMLICIQIIQEHIRDIFMEREFFVIKFLTQKFNKSI